MRSLYTRIVIAGLLSAALSPAADIEGRVIVKRRLTKLKVTPSVGLYDRGSAVESNPVTLVGGLGFERTHVAIYLDGPLLSEPVTAVLEQKNRQFVSDLLVICAGSSVSFPNLDPIFHNVFSLSKPKPFDLGNYPKNHTRLVTFPKPGIVFVNCRLHPNMGAAIVVTPNRWNTVPDTTGKFILQDVPDGHYTVVAWHKTAGFFRQSVHVAGGRVPAIEFIIPFDENGVVVSKR